VPEHSKFVPAEPEGPVVSPESWNVLREQAAVLVRSGFLPNGVNTPEKAISIVMKGRELGIPPMYALSNIAVINGKPTASAELMLALVYRDHGDEAVRIVESTAERCTVAYRRRGWQEPELFSFDIEDAQCAGLLSKDNWRHYPAAMLRARCISAVARMAFPDTIGGLYTPEELGARVLVREDGEQYLAGETRVNDRPANSVDMDSVDGEIVGRPADPVNGAAADRKADSNDGDVVSRQATPAQCEAVARLSRLLHLPEPDGVLSAEEASELLARLSRQFNALGPEERRRRTRSRG
jgi:hypothetical protein